MRPGLAIVLAGITTSACELVFRPSGTSSMIDADPNAPDADPDAPDADPDRPDAGVDAEPPPDAPVCNPPTIACFLNGGGVDSATCLSSPPVDYCGLAALDDLDPYDICGCTLPAIYVVDNGLPDLVLVVPFTNSYRLVVNGTGCTPQPLACSLAFDGECQNEALIRWPDVPLETGSNSIGIYDEIDTECNDLVYFFSVDF